MSDLDLRQTYCLRFRGEEERRKQVWSVLATSFFSQWIRPTDTVLDLGAGHCEFINAVNAAVRYALDLNPDTSALAADGVRVLEHDAATKWDLPSNSLDVVFTSNFLEHMPSKQAVLSALAEARRTLRPGGHLIAMGPNVRFCYDTYWDYFDHYVPLSERSIVEALQNMSLEPQRVVPRFLPYTMKGRLATSRVPFSLHLALLKLYLRCQPAWKLVGKQFLVVARKSDEKTSDNRRPRL